MENFSIVIAGGGSNYYTPGIIVTLLNQFR